MIWNCLSAVDLHNLNQQWLQWMLTPDSEKENHIQNCNEASVLFYVSYLRCWNLFLSLTGKGFFYITEIHWFGVAVQLILCVQFEGKLQRGSCPYVKTNDTKHLCGKNCHSHFHALWIYFVMWYDLRAVILLTFRNVENL